MTNAHLFVVVVAIAFVLGLRGSVRLTRRYADVSALLVRRERAILGSFVIVAWLITGAAGFFGALSARRLLGYEAIDWTPFASVIVASVILFIPVFLDYVVDRVARVPWQ